MQLYATLLQLMQLYCINLCNYMQLYATYATICNYMQLGVAI
jgi:hypothetical protein